MAAIWPGFGQPPAARPNIILILADDLGYGDLGVYGATDTKTPNLDRLAREGTRFTDFYANAPVCTPTRAGLITGRYQQRVMLERPLSSVGDDLQASLPVTGRSLPQLMAEAGYATALLGKWHLGFMPEAGPRAHGFGYFWGYLSGYLDWYTHVRGDGQPDLWENESPTTHRGYFHHETTRRAIRFIEQHKAEPFFLDLSYGAPHWPFQSPTTPSVAKREDNSMMQQPSDDNAPARADYVAIMEDFDREIGKVLDAIRVQGLEQNTLVIFTSDNGGEWLSRNDPFFNRKDTVWEGGIRVPAIVRWPGVVPADTVTSQVGITMDFTAHLPRACRREPSRSEARRHRPDADADARARMSSGRSTGALSGRTPRSVPYGRATTSSSRTAACMFLLQRAHGSGRASRSRRPRPVSCPGDANAGHGVGEGRGPGGERGGEEVGEARQKATLRLEPSPRT